MTTRLWATMRNIQNLLISLKIRFQQQKDHQINLARFIIAKGQIAIQERNNKELKTLINEGKKYYQP